MTSPAPRVDPRGPSGPRGVDLMSWPVLGRFLRWRHARLALQLPLLALAVLLVVQGLFGPQLAPKNLTTLLVWVHWRGLLVLGLLVAGNVFCMGCPLLLPRELARRLRTPRLRLPRRLRGKAPALVLLVAVLFVYEWLDLWASPAMTAWVIVGYFGLALVVDSVFAGAPFCKHVCPIGQFNFVASTASPLEVRVRDAGTCTSCATVDCIKGRRDPQRPERVLQRGCELALFLPRKVGNLDCTFCLDCVHACPEDNVALASRTPGAELADDRLRSGVGRISRRGDLCLLVVVFVFGGLLNAFGMVRPVYAFQQWLAAGLGTRSEGLVLAVLFVLGLVVVPLLVLVPTAWTSRALVGERGSLARHLRCFVPGLAPLGFGVWLAHYSFHFLTGLWTFVPVAQHALARAGWPVLGEPRWGLGGLREAQVWPIELGFLGLGLAGSLGVTWRIALREQGSGARRGFLPWALTCVVLAACALWLLAQPMEMRGTFL